MFVSVESARGALAVKVHGELDLASAEALRSALDGASAGPTTAIELDLSAVTFVDCAGMRAVLASVRSARRRGHAVSVVDASKCVARLSTAWGAARVPGPV